MSDINEPMDVQHEEKSRSKLPYIIVGFGVLLVLILVVAFIMLGGTSSATSPIRQVDNDQFYSYTFPEPFVGNLAPPDDHFLYNARVTIEIKPRGRISEREALQEIGIEADTPRSKRIRVKNVIHQELRKRTRTDLTSTAGQNALRASIRNELNLILEKAEIINVFVFLTVN